MNTLKQRIVRLLYPYGAVRRVLRGPAKGYRYVVTPGMGFMYALGIDSGNWSFLQRQIRQGTVIYDAGANVGQMALLLSKAIGPTGTVVSYEPVREVFSLLERNIAMNRIRNVSPFNFALSDRDGNAEFAYSVSNPTQGKLGDVERTYTDPQASINRVAAKRLDTAVSDGLPPPQLIKIDVEGGAASLLRGARRVIEEQSPTIYIELHGPEEQAGIRDELLAHGYLAETLNGNFVSDPTDGWHNPLWCYRPSKPSY